MKIRFILSAALLGASALAISTEAAASTYYYTDPVTGVVRGTGNVVTGVVDGGAALVGGVADGTGTVLRGAGRGTTYMVRDATGPVYYRAYHKPMYYKSHKKVYVTKTYRNNRLVNVRKTVVY
jgi:hypothetical protein